MELLDLVIGFETDKHADELMAVLGVAEVLHAAFSILNRVYRQPI